MSSLTVTLAELLAGGACITTSPKVFEPKIPSGRPPKIPRPDPAAQARAICESCDFTAECLEQQIQFEWGIDAPYRYGVWGATTAVERHAIERARRAHAREGRRGPARTIPHHHARRGF